MFDKSYKGSNLALMVELLAGPLVGAAVADKLAERNWGNLVVALDPGLMGDRGLIRERMQAVLDRCGRGREREHLWKCGPAYGHDNMQPAGGWVTRPNSCLHPPSLLPTHFLSPLPLMQGAQCQAPAGCGRDPAARGAGQQAGGQPVGGGISAH